jgi:nucleotide-binding universal stress UspA family protein
MVPVPSQTPLSDAPEYMKEGREGIITAFEHLSPQFPISSTIRYCRSIARGIVSTVREKKVDYLVLGWHGKHRGFGFHIGSTIDPVIERSPCNVVIMKELADKKFRKVLVPLAGGPNAAFALEIASILVEDDGEIVAFTVGGRKRGFDIQRFVDDNRARLHIPGKQVHAKVVFTGNIVDSILEEAQNYDLLVLGATARSMVSRMTSDPVPEAVARKCEKPFVMVRSSAGITNWLQRWI